jgi:hypothetical protein
LAQAARACMTKAAVLCVPAADARMMPRGAHAGRSGVVNHAQNTS